MKKCHVCSFECEDTAELCPKCGAQLKEENEVLSKEELTVKNPVLAVSVEDVVTLEIYRDVLKENGINFTCGSENDSMKLMFGGTFVAEDIYVDDADLERAKELYDEVLNTEPTFEEFEFDYDELKDDEAEQ